MPNTETTHHYLARYAVTGESNGDGPVVISARRGPTLQDDGTYMLAIDLAYARSRDMDDRDAARRIIAIAHPGRFAPEQIELIELVENGAAS